MQAERFYQQDLLAEVPDAARPASARLSVLIGGVFAQTAQTRVNSLILSGNRQRKHDARRSFP